MSEKSKMTELISDFLGYLPWGQIASGTAEELSDYLLKNGVRLEQSIIEERKEWIPVSERSPEPETDVLTFCCGNIDILTYRYNKWGEVRFMFRDECGYWKETFGEVTHWMPLPEPPKEDEL